MNYHIGRLVLSSLCAGDLVRLVLSGVRFAGWSTTSASASACQTNTTQNQPHQISSTQRTENKTTDVVIQQHSRKLLIMDILMSETCWAHKKWNKIASDMELVFHFSTIRIFYLVLADCATWQWHEPRQTVNVQPVRAIFHSVARTSTFVSWSDHLWSYKRFPLNFSLPTDW